MRGWRRASIVFLPVSGVLCASYHDDGIRPFRLKHHSRCFNLWLVVTLDDLRREVLKRQSRGEGAPDGIEVWPQRVGLCVSFVADHLTPD